MAKTAFISDIHANLEALEVVLAEIDQNGIEEIYCLGDVVGYGPDPGACIDLVMDRCRLTIRGNHDEAVIKGPLAFNPLAREAIEWTRKSMKPRFWNAASRRRWEFLLGLPQQGQWEDCMLVHGSPRDPTSEYVMDRDIIFGPPEMFPEIFAAFSTVCLVGHTHIPGIFYAGPKFVSQKDSPESFAREDKKLLINVGSVGQPRDRDPRSCYLTCEDGRFRFHRLEYDFKKTQQKILQHSQLDPRLAERLAEGS